MKRFQRIDTERELMLSFEKTLKELDYFELNNFNGGYNDFLMIDTLRKEYIWCENGFAPFCSDEMMNEYEYSEINELINLKILSLQRY
jgi:hypothetical protein